MNALLEIKFTGPPSFLSLTIYCKQWKGEGKAENLAKV